MPCVIHSLLILAIGVVHAFGAYATVEIRHSHDMEEGHHHEHAPVEQKGDHDHHGHDHHQGQGHDHHGHDHAPADEPTEPNDSENGESHRPTHEHTHTKTIGGDAPLVMPDFAKASCLRLASTHAIILDRDSCPDGPYFGLIKPPQLG